MTRRNAPASGYTGVVPPTDRPFTITTTTGRRPNFVLIITDTQATNVLGCYGHPELRTPRIDGLASQGVTFERAYTTSPLCTPARAGLFTGRYPQNSGAWVNGLPLGTSFPHMGQRFRDEGYRTGYTGKWHLDGHDYFGTGVCPDGWDDKYWYDGRRHLETLTDEERVLWRQGLRTYEALKEHDVQADWCWGHRVSDRAIQFIEDSRATPDQPFVLVVSYDEPHGPFTCPPSYVKPFLDYKYSLGPQAFDTLENKPVHQREWNEMRERNDQTRREHAWITPLYFGCNSFVDQEIGRVIDAVDRFAPEDTWIIYTSDHGEMMGSHGINSKGATVYEEMANIPLIVRPPAGARSVPTGAGSGSTASDWGSGSSGTGFTSASSSGTSSSTDTGASSGSSANVASSVGTRPRAAVSHIDVLPTMLDLAGLNVPPALEGASLTPILSGEADPHDPERSAIVVFHRYELPSDGLGGFTPMRAIVKGDQKLAIHLLDTDELYDNAADPAELNNLIDDPAYAERRDALHDELIDWMYHVRDPFRSPAWERRPWRDPSTLRLAWNGGWKGERNQWSDGYAPTRLNYATGLPQDR